MRHTADIIDAITFFPRAFAVIMALALGEALRQFVADRAERPEDRVIHWDRLPALLSFLLLILPFYQGMSRYFFVTYGDPDHLPQPYSFYLMFDAVNFLTESALFFVMSSALSPGQWRRYYGSVMCLLVVDSIWGVASAATHGGPIEIWMKLNIVFSIVMLAILWFFRREFRSARIAWLGCMAVLVRTVLDYAWSWDFYFPS